jgi:ubiquinone/menaquinone biosynthesis C-methylase UbiE
LALDDSPAERLAGVRGTEKVEKNFSTRLLDWRYGLVADHIEDRQRVLDLGAGTGWVGKRLAERKGCDVRLVDVLDCNETDLPLTVYDGKTIPFDDKSFDVVTLVFVLHHAVNQEEILREAARVARSKIILIEDTPRNRLERWIDQACDALMSFEHGFHNPATYRNVAQWRSIFETLRLALVHEHEIEPFFPFYYTKAVFVLDVAAAPGD